MSTGRICPKCHYQREPEDDASCPEYECPKCGIIYDKFIQPKVTTSHKADKTNSPQASLPHNKNSRTFSISIKQIVSCASILIAVFVVYIVFTNSFGSKSDLSGTYSGEMVMDRESVFVEFDIDDQQRITRIFKKEVREVHADGIYEIENKFLWQYPDISEIRVDIYDYENHYLMFKKNGDACAIEISDSENGFKINSTVNIHDSEQSLPEIEIKNLSTNKDIFYIQFSHNLFKKREIIISREDVTIPGKISFENIGKYCPVTSHKSNLYPFHDKNYTINVNECKFGMKYMDFRPELKFKVLMEEINFPSESMPIVEREKINEILFYPDTNDPMLTFEIPPYRFFSRISLNNSKGWGQFGHHFNAEILSLPVSKAGLDLTEEDIENSAGEWRTVFIKSDPRYKNGTFKTVKKRGQKAGRQAMDKMKLADPEQND